MINEQKFTFYQADIEAKLTDIVSRFLKTNDLEDFEFLFDLSLPTGANQYVVRVKVEGAYRHFVARLSTTYEFAGLTHPDIRGDVDEVEIESWPPPKVKIRNSTYVLRFK